MAIGRGYNQNMFYISRNIETEVFFTHHEMDKAGTESEVLRRLRQKVEGYCDQEYGYIIQVLPASCRSSLPVRRACRWSGWTSARKDCSPE